MSKKIHVRNLHVDRLARGSAAAFLIYGISAGLAYCAQLVIARMIGAENYGIYAYVFSWMTVLAYFSALGFDVSLLRFVPTYRARLEPGLVRGVVRYAERMAGVVGVCVLVLGAFIIAICGRGWSSELENTFFIGLALVPIWALLWIRCSVARAFGGIVSALAPERIARDGLLLCLLGIGYIGLGRNFDAPLTMSALLVSSAAALGLVSVAARRLASDELVDVAPMYAGRIWLRAAMPLVLIGTVEPLLNRSGVILLGWHGSVTDAGIYAMAFNVAFLVVLPRTSVNALFAPAAADLFARNDREKLQALITRTAVWTLVSALCIAIPLSLVAQPILGWFGRGFDAGAMALRILLFGQVASAGAGSQLYLMTMTGHERRAALLLALSAAANVIIGIVFVRELGLIGAAISTTATLVAWNVAMGWFIWRNLQLVPGVLGLYSSLAAPRKRQMRKHGGMTGADIVHLASGESPNDRRVG